MVGFCPDCGEMLEAHICDGSVEVRPHFDYDGKICSGGDSVPVGVVDEED